MTQKTNLFCYAVQVIGGQEFKTKRQIEYNLAKSKQLKGKVMKDIYIDVPTYIGRDSKNKLKVKLLITGYLIIMSSDEKISGACWHLLKASGVKRIFRNSFSQDVIEKMILRAMQIEEISQKKQLVMLDRVRKMKETIRKKLDKSFVRSPKAGQDKVVADTSIKGDRIINRLMPLLN